jgi:hypothetical protein
MQPCDYMRRGGGVSIRTPDPVAEEAMITEYVAPPIIHPHPRVRAEEDADFERPGYGLRTL